MSSSLTSLQNSKIIIINKTISQYCIGSININLNNSADIVVGLYDSSGNFIQTKGFTMSGIDYTNWGNNDIPYVTNWIENQISNLTSI